MSESSKLHELAHAMDDLAAMHERAANQTKPPEGIRIDWSTGSALYGYKQLAPAMAEVIRDRFLELRDEAIRRATDRVQQLRKDIGLPFEVTITAELTPGKPFVGGEPRPELPALPSGDPEYVEGISSGVLARSE